MVNEILYKLCENIFTNYCEGQDITTNKAATLITCYLPERHLFDWMIGSNQLWIDVKFWDYIKAASGLTEKETKEILIQLVKQKYIPEIREGCTIAPIDYSELWSG